MEIINQSMIFLLEALHQVVGNYGIAIIALTVLVRFVLWPVSRSQILSMKKMQELQPKLKLIQERFKSDPQRLQQEMMKLYKENKFNPFGGCLPLLIQLPLFLGLYGAISSPYFMTESDPTFLNFIHLKHSGIVSHAGPSHDGVMSIGENGGQGGLFGIGRDSLGADSSMQVTLTNDNTIKLKVPDPNKALTFKPAKLLPGAEVKVSTTLGRLGLEDYEGQIHSVKMNVLNTGSKEMEKITFEPEEGTSKLVTRMETQAGNQVVNWDVILLVAIFGVTMLMSQKMMTTSSTPANDQQQAMMKMMPIMFTVLLIFFPIPSGVLLYMGTNSVFQVLQTWYFQRMDGSSKEDTASDRVVDIKPDSVKESPSV